MTIYCGVCRTRIGAAYENEGSFEVSNDFNGWDKDDKGKSVIRDTCEYCGIALRAAIVEAATIAANKCIKQIAEMKLAQTKANEEFEALEKAKQEFEITWRKEREQNKK